MCETPELTFRGALSVLGHYDRPVLDRLNSLLGGVIMAGGAVALTGPAAAPVVGAAAAIWGWVDQKNEALGLVRKLLDKVGDYRAASRCLDRTQLIAAAHTVLVASCVVDAFRRHAGERAFAALDLTDKELAVVMARPGLNGRTFADLAYGTRVPMPSSGCGFQDNVPKVASWQRTFATALFEFCSGLKAGEAIRHVNVALVRRDANDAYQDQYRRMAATVPEFLVWALLNEHAATTTMVANAHADVKAALAGQAQVMSRLESLLTAVSGAEPDHVSAVHRAAQAGLDEPVVVRDHRTDLRFPLIRDIFIQPSYRCGKMEAHSPIADEQWWRHLSRHDDLDLRLAAHLASTEGARLPLLVLGHPGAGKSLLMKVLAARLPSDQYTTVYVPLRHVSSTAAVYEQVDQALVRETNGRADWASLVNQTRATTLVILLDGLDELLQAADRDRAGYLDEVAEFQWREAAQGRHVVAVVTSRTLVADRVEVPVGTTTVKLEEFDTAQIEQWRQVWNGVNRDAIESGAVRELTEEALAHQPELARQPLLLLMLAMYSADPSFPAIESGLSKTALYRTLFDNFTRRESTKLPDGDEPQDQLQRLSVAALGMFNRGRQHITDVELAADLAALTPDDGRREPDQRLVAQFFFVHTAEANLGTDRTRRSYEFLHATFGEYLVAREVVETLVDTADSTVSRRGARDPDDDRLFALLSHDCLAVRGPVLDFIGDLMVGLPPEDRERLTQTLVTLLAGARRRQGSPRFSDYRPTTTDHVRAIAAYSANLVLLSLLSVFDADIDDLVEQSQWRPMLDLWRAGLDRDSWHALLATINRDGDTVILSGNRYRSTGLDAELRHAELAGDTLINLTLRMGRTIRESMYDLTEVESPKSPDTDYEELVGWLVAVLAIGEEPERPMHKDRLGELLESLNDDFILSMSAMVLKQRADRIPIEVAHDLVEHLLHHNCHDTYALLIAAAAHPDLLTEFPQLLEPERYAGMQGTVLLLEALLETMPTAPKARFTHLLEALRDTAPSADLAAAALLDAFQWRLDP